MMEQRVVNTYVRGRQTRFHGTIQPTACFCTVWEMGVVFYIFRWSKKNQERNQNFVTCESDMKFKFQQRWIKFYWHRATFAGLHIVCGCFCSTTAELRSSDRDLYGPQKLLTVWPYTENACPPVVERRETSLLLNVIKKEVTHLPYFSVALYISFDPSNSPS